MQSNRTNRLIVGENVGSMCTLTDTMAKVLKDNAAVLSVQNLNKFYPSGGHELQVLSDVQFEIYRGEAVAIVGPSGSGKTTLLGLCAGLDTATSGDVVLAGSDLGALTEDERASLRSQHVGFIFQNFQLLPTLTALENVSVPLELRGEGTALGRAAELLSAVGLSERGEHYPVQLSGGEQQRVALARAFANTPELLFADEPTGNLDEQTSERISTMLFALNKEKGTTLILVTHDMDLAKRCDRILQISGGRLKETVSEIDI